MYFSVVGRIHRRHVDRRRRRRKTTEEMQKPNKKKKGDIHIPEEVMEQILSRVSVKSLSRFKCVCKAWYNLLSSKDFTFLHFNSYKPCDITIAGLNFDSEISILYGITVPTTRGCAAAATRVKYILPKKKGSEYSEIGYGICQGNCKGIFSLYSRGRILLWNPAIYDFKVIPMPNIIYQAPQNYTTNCRAKVGFDPIANDFKVLYIRYHGSTDLQHRIHLYLYSLGNNSWRNLDASILDSLDVHVARPCFSTNTKIVWVAGSKSIKVCLCLFDLSSETFDTIPVPIEDDIAYGNVHVYPFGESVAAVINQPPKYSGCFEIWALNDLSCCPQSRSWSKLWKTPHLQRQIQPVGFWGSSFLICRCTGYHDVVLYDLVKQVVVNFEAGVHKAAMPLPFVYQESLIRISD